MNTVTFWSTFKESLRFFGKNVHRYLLITFFSLLPLLLLGALLFGVAKFAVGAQAQDIVTGLEGVSYSVSPEASSFLKTAAGVFGAALFAVLLPLILIAVLYGVFVKLCFITLTTVLKNGMEVEYGKILKFSFKKMWSYLMLGIRIFVYTWIWLPAALLAALGVLNTLGTIPVSVTTIGTIASFALAALLALIRMPRTIFAVFPLVEKDAPSKEALKESVETSEGHWWNIVLYSIGYAFLLSAFIGVISWIFGLISAGVGVFLMNLGSWALTVAIIGFQYDLYKGWKKA